LIQPLGAIGIMLMENLELKFLNLHASVIFIFALISTFNWSSSTDSTPENVTLVLNSLGQIGLAIWIYAVANKSNNIMIKKGLSTNAFKKFQISYLVMIASLCLLFVMNFIDPEMVLTQSDIERGEAFTYKRIIYGLFFSLIAAEVFVAKGAAKLLESAEHGANRSINEYYKTFLLLLLPWIGIWFVHPKAQKLV